MRTLTGEQALADPGPWQRRAARASAGPLEWADDVVGGWLPVSAGRDGGGGLLRQVLLLAAGRTPLRRSGAAAGKMVMPDGFTAAVHIHGSPGRGPGWVPGTWLACWIGWAGPAAGVAGVVRRG